MAIINKEDWVEWTSNQETTNMITDLDATQFTDTPYVQIDKNVSLAKSFLVNTKADAEELLTNNIILMSVETVDEGYRVRCIDTDTHASPQTVDYFLESIEDRLYNTNVAMGTIGGINDQIEEGEGLREFFYIVLRDETSFSILKGVTDGNFVYE